MLGHHTFRSKLHQITNLINLGFNVLKITKLKNKLLIVSKNERS